MWTRRSLFDENKDGMTNGSTLWLIEGKYWMDDSLRKMKAP